ncbi:hypothetical protein AWB61_03170 [Chromobacterium sp. F49]|nr:hypothetical protein Cv017_01625 [Chromobacterium subtsugae]KZE84992.1 hypothetical protein AWB61_03170 [Chromobacterium sp. F49]
MSIAATIARSIELEGVGLTIIHLLAAGYDPVARRPTQSRQVWEGKGLPSAVKDDEINGTSILAGDQRIRIMHPGFVPAPNDNLLHEGATWNVSNVQATYDRGVAVSFRLLIRK